MKMVHEFYRAEKRKKEGEAEVILERGREASLPIYFISLD